ncbi:MAG: KH domain-containing protein [Acholeplasmatales bacterium]|nr:KH domain-containing protein [Acholeplasmatales bacterium]
MVNFEELIKSLILPLVSFPEEVEIAYIGEEDGVESYEVKVAKFDLGRVIGKGGHIAQAIRTILYAKASKEGVRVHLNIIEK